MSDDVTNGRATIREVRDLLDAHERNDRARSDDLRNWLDDKLSALDEKYVWRQSCVERHRYIDPRQIWAAAAILSIIGPALTALIIGAL